MMTFQCWTPSKNHLTKNNSCKVSRLHAISNRLCSKHISLRKLRKKIDLIESRTKNVNSSGPTIETIEKRPKRSRNITFDNYSFYLKILSTFSKSIIRKTTRSNLFKLCLEAKDFICSINIKI